MFVICFWSKAICMLVFWLEILTFFVLGFWPRVICKFRIVYSRFILVAWSVFSFITLSINVLAFKSMFLGMLIRIEIIIFSGEDKILRFFPFGVIGAWYIVIEISELIIAVSSYIYNALNGFESFISKIFLIYYFTLRRLSLLWS